MNQWDCPAGTFAAPSSPPARANRLDSSDIIDNGNSAGPVVFTVKPTDKAVTVSGCETFTKVS